MLHTGLIRLLANPATAPRLSVNCFETTLDVLHFDIKVRGKRPGTVVMPFPRRPHAWHELYPLDFDHAVAGAIDVEGDRQRMLQWWREYAGEPAMLAGGRRFRPKSDRLWRLLSRGYADRWSYMPDRQVVLCADGQADPALLQGVTHDYNLVRAVCAFLGSRGDADGQDRLIQIVAGPSAVLSYNALFALSFSRDVRIRELIERYKKTGPPREESGAETENVPMRL
jgi:hypothetical protein